MAKKSSKTPEQRALERKVAESPFLRKLAADLRKSMAEDSFSWRRAGEALDRHYRNPISKSTKRDTPKKRQNTKEKLVEGALPRLFPKGTDRFTPEAIRKLVVADPVVIAECKRLGVSLPSRGVIARVLNRWRH